MKLLGRAPYLIGIQAEIEVPVKVQALLTASFVGARSGIGSTAKADQTELVEGHALLVEQIVEIAYVGTDEGVVFAGHGAGFVDHYHHVQGGGRVQHAAGKHAADDRRK